MLVRYYQCHLFMEDQHRVILVEPVLDYILYGLEKVKVCKRYIKIILIKLLLAFTVAKGC